MQLLLNTLKRHPVAIAFYLVYLLLITRYYSGRADLARQMILHPERSGIQNGGEAVQLVFISIIIFGSVFAFVTAGYAIGAKNNQFYLYLLTLIVVTLIILGNI